jgi:Chaperone of endosialidase
MNQAFKLSVIVIGAMMGMGDRALAQCFVCSDSYGNSLVGTSALHTNSTGPNNTAVGYQALYSNTGGKGNAAQGVNALYSNTSGIRNLGIGSNALYGNTTGSYNVALGYEAGYDQTTGNDNIYINNVGVSGESQTLRLGVQGTSGVLGSGIITAYIAGVATSQITGSAVYVTSTGQLGVQGSSERFKTDIVPMPELSGNLQQLRPVTFRYKTDPKGVRQYGLIAEEVDKVYPELVIRDDAGKIAGIHYEELAPMLLAEVQHQHAIIQTLAEQNATQAHRIDAQAAELREVKNLVVQMQAGLNKLEAKDALVAGR